MHGRLLTEVYPQSKHAASPEGGHLDGNGTTYKPAAFKESTHINSPLTHRNSMDHYFPPPGLYLDPTASFVKPSPTNRPKERIILAKPTLARFMQLGRQTLIERGFYMVVFHLLFWAISLLLPGFDTSCDFVRGSLWNTYQVAFGAWLFVAPVGTMYFAVPIAMRYSECKEAGNFVPANALRNSWGSPGVRRWTAHVLIVLASVAGAYVRRAVGENGVVDPFHAGVLGALARVLFAARWQLKEGERWWEENAHAPSDIADWDRIW
ncbi:hypothetical protein C8T65DRAFT_743776 [Cerioporus squamosus]|nr:hypothetical protein C8T65DRAFT_743776 [Cerioporus squamosus]